MNKIFFSLSSSSSANYSLNFDLWNSLILSIRSLELEELFAIVFELFKELGAMELKAALCYFIYLFIVEIMSSPFNMC